MPQARHELKVRVSNKICFKQLKAYQTENLMRKIRTEVVIETTEVYVIKHQRHFIRTWCEDCGREVSLVSPSEAALLTFQEPAAIYSLIDERRVHFRFFEEQIPFICLTSLCLI